MEDCRRGPLRSFPYEWRVKKRDAVRAKARQEKGWSICLASFECETQKSFGMRQTRTQLGQFRRTQMPYPFLWRSGWLGGLVRSALGTFFGVGLVLGKTVGKYESLEARLHYLDKQQAGLVDLRRRRRSVRGSVVCSS